MKAASSNLNQAIAPLVELCASDLEVVNHLLTSSLTSDTALIRDITEHVVGTGGKRIRPMLTLAFCALFEPGPILSQTAGVDRRHLLAASIEYMHTATLLHDDVVDESSLRRGSPAARSIWGNQASILVGDFLLGQAFIMMVKSQNLLVLDILSAASATIAEGEVSQLTNVGNLGLTRDEYFALIDKKTSSLFAAATSVGPALAGVPDDQLALCSKYGRQLGHAFQLMDDYLDYCGDSETVGKNMGDDLREGKLTLPVIVALEQADASEREFWQSCFSGAQVDERDFSKARDLVDKRGGLSTTKQLAHDCCQQAIETLRLIEKGLSSESNSLMPHSPMPHSPMPNSLMPNSLMPHFRDNKSCGDTTFDENNHGTSGGSTSGGNTRGGNTRGGSTRGESTRGESASSDNTQQSIFHALESLPRYITERDK